MCVQDKEGLLRRMTEHRAARDAALEEQRAERENAELAECTFQPTRVTVTAPVQPKVPPTKTAPGTFCQVMLSLPLAAQHIHCLVGNCTDG